MIASGSARHRKGFGFSLCSATKRLMASRSSAMERKTPSSPFVPERAKRWNQTTRSENFYEKVHSMIPYKIKHDEKLFNLLMEDEAKVEPIWRTPKYWSNYAYAIRQRINSHDMARLRSTNYLLDGFANSGRLEATPPKSALKRVIWDLAHRMPGSAHAIAAYRQLLEIGQDRALFAEIGRAKGVLAEISQAGFAVVPPTSLQYGEPLDLFSHGDTMVGAFWVEYLARAADFYSVVPPPEVETIVEVGPGLGLSTLSHIALNSNIKTIVNIDVPTTLYISTQFLKAEPRFSVIDYCSIRDNSKIEIPSKFNRQEKPEIIQIPPWMADRLIGRADLFCNAFSFYEMHERQVQSYINIIDNLQTRFCHFNMAKTGKVLSHGPEIAISQSYISKALSGIEFETPTVLNGINEKYYPIDTRVALIFSRKLPDSS